MNEQELNWLIDELRDEAQGILKERDELKKLIKTENDMLRVDTHCTNCQGEFIKEINELREAIDELTTEKAELIEKLNKLSDIIWRKRK